MTAFVYEDGAIVTIQHLGTSPPTGLDPERDHEREPRIVARSFRSSVPKRAATLRGEDGGGLTASAVPRTQRHAPVHLPGRRGAAAVRLEHYTDDGSLHAAVYSAVHARIRRPRDDQIGAGELVHLPREHNGIKSQSFGRPGSASPSRAPPGSARRQWHDHDDGRRRPRTPPTGTATGTVLVSSRPFRAA
jgi:hypothetical protein